MSSTDRKALAREEQGLGESPALLVVDAINGFTDPDCPLGSEADSVVEANRRLMDVFHAQSLPVFLTTVVYDNDDQASVFRARVPALNVLERGSHWCEIDPRLPLASSDTIIERPMPARFMGLTWPISSKAQASTRL